MPYSIKLPDGTVVADIPDDVTPQQAKARILARRPDLLGQAEKPKAPVETTTFGQVKEFGKGLVPGAVGLVESAAIGASALLPEDMEKSARETIKSVATSAKTPFAAAEGYEDSVGRKLGEAVGSTVPFLAAGPLGLAGRIGAAGLGVGAGAGEARTRAEAAGATDEERGTATALGILPGAAEVFAPFRILSRLPDAATATGVQMVKRALVAGGEEAAQEAASGFAQNLIARGVYKPEQELIEGLGEQAAYGGATGAIVQGLLDLAIGRRARGSAQESELQTQLEERVLGAREERKAPVLPEDLPANAAYEELVLERERLRELRQTPEVKAKIAEIDKRAKAILTTSLADREKAAKSAFSQEDQQMTMREFADDAQTEPGVATTEEDVAPAAKDMTIKQAIKARVPTMQMPLMFDQERGAQEETVPGAITMEELQGIGKPMRSSKSWFETNVVGKTPEQVQAMVDADPKLIEGKGDRAKVLREVLAPKPAEFVEAQDAKAAPSGRPERETDGQPAESGVGTPVGEPIGADTAGTEALDGAGVVPAGRDAGPQPTAPRAAPPTVTQQEAAFDELARAVQDETSPDYAAAGQILEANRNNPAFLREYDRAVRRLQGIPQQEVAQQRAPQAPTERVEADEDVGQLPAQAPLFPMTPQAEVELAQQQARADQSRETRELEAQRKEAWAGVPDVKRTKQAQTQLFPEKAKTQRKQPKRTAQVIDFPTKPPAAPEAVDKIVRFRYMGGDRGALVHLDNGKIVELMYWSPDRTWTVVGTKGQYDLAADLDQAAQEVLDAEQSGANLPEVSKNTRDAMAQSTPKTKSELTFSERREMQLDEQEDAAEALPIGGPKVERSALRGAISPELTAAVQAGDTRAALEAIMASQKFSALDREVAKRLLRNKSLPKIAVDPALASSGQYFPSTDTAVVREIDAHTVLHEVVHGFVHRLIAAENAGKVQSAGVRKLREVMLYARKTNPKLADTYGFKNLSEFASEVMSNPELQAELQKIPYQRTNAFTAFARAVLDLLGIKATTENTALAESLIAVDAVLDVGRDMQVAEAGTNVEPGMGDEPALRKESKKAMQPATKSDFDEIVDSSELMKDEPGMFKQAGKQLVDAFTTAEGVTFGDRFRTLVADAGASMETKINLLFDGAIRSAKGILNPMGLYRQAQDTSKLLLTWFEDGALVKNADTGTYETASKEGVPSMKEVLTDVQAWAQSKGIPLDKGMGQFSKMLEALRLDALRKSNAAGTTNFSINKLSLKDSRTADEQIDIALKEYDANPELAKIKAKMDTIRLELIDQMVAVGRLTPEEGTQWKEATDYVPFDRIEDFSTKFRTAKRTGGGIAQLGKLPELVTTKEREVGDVLNNFTKTAGWMLNQVVKQDATLTTLRMLEDMGYAKFLGKTAGSTPTEKRVQSYINGEQVFFELPSRWDVLAFRDMAQPKGFFVDLFSGASDLLRKTITSMPPFAVRQVINDIQRAFATSGVQNPYAIILPALRNFVTISAAEVMGKRHPSVQKFGKLGITGDYDFNTRNPMDSIMYDLGFKARGPLGGLLHRLDGITRASDLAVRKAIYDRTLTESQDTLLAQTRAREFINFRRRGAGAAMPALTATIPFFNAYVQGMDVLYRAATGKGASASVGKAQARRLFASKVATMASFAAIYAIMMSGEDEYEEADLRTRNNNWLLPGGFKLPVPEELAAIYKVPVEMALEYFRRNGTPEDMEAAEASITALKYAFEQYLGRTVPIPAAVKPVVEAITNHSFFTGEQLEGTFQQELVSSQRVRSNTSELAKAIANFTSETFGERATISPIKIDNFLQGYFGSVSGMLTMATDQLINPDRIDRPLNKYWMLSNFLHDPVGTRRVNEFYEMREKVVPKLNTLRELAKYDPVRAEEYMKVHEQDLILAQSINSALAQLSDTRGYKNFLNSKAAADMSMEDRKAQLEEVRRMEVELVGWLREARASLRNQ